MGTCYEYEGRAAMCKTAFTKLEDTGPMHSPHSPTVKKRHTICVFCGSSPGIDPRYAQAARELGRGIAEHGCALVFGGGDVGLMGETARAVRDGGAPVIGILPAFLRHLEPPLKSAEELIILPDLFQRKDRMIAMSDAFMLLPGGLGTLDEFFEVVTAAQLHVHAKPIVAVNVAGFFDPLRALMDHVIAQGFAQPSAKSLYHLADTPEAALRFVTEEIARAAL
jgi:uncharacterized protein (TIGR00730 family)